MKLELKHLAPYLPYGLKGVYHESIITLSLNGFSSATEIGYDISLFLKCEIKPILRPLSDLTIEITHNGQTFVPIEWFEEKYFATDLPAQCERIIEDDRWVNQSSYMLIEQLFEWHFDVFGLIEKGLAIDINN
jgi:hypothetical protein